MFKNLDEAHAHSLETLDLLYKYGDFMRSIKTVADLGCGSGKDLVWWATRTTDDEDRPEPLDIKCQGIDILESLPVARQYPNMTYQKVDFEDTIHPPEEKYDILWCHNSFQYVTNPLKTLKKWRDITSDGAMLSIIVPQTTNIFRRDLDFKQEDGCYFHHTIVSLIHMLAVTGWDCRAGFFKKAPNDPWIHAVVYKSDQEARDPKTTRWYDLVESGLLPESAEKGIKAKGFLEQKDLILPWLDRSLHWLGQN
jgi:SAM-dependent methyltransferase